MPRSHRLTRRALPTELLAWAAGGVVFGTAAAARLADVPLSREVDLTLPLATVAALPIPLRFLQLFSPGRHDALARFLGESVGARLQAIVADCWAISGAWVLGLALGGAAWAVVGGAAVPWLLPWWVASVCAASVCMLLAALQQVAGANVERFSALTGGGAFGPPQTAPMLYAPALGLTVGLFVPVMLCAVVASLQRESPAPLSMLVAAAPWAIGTAVLSVVAPVVVSMRWVHAGAWRRPMLLVEAGFAQGFYRAEDHSPAPRWLTAMSGDDPGLRALATAWHRRFPASIAASLGLSAFFAWLVPTDAPALLLAACAASVCVYSAGRASDLHAAMPSVLPALRFLGGFRPNAALRRLQLRLALPAAAAVMLAFTSGQWLATLAGLGAGAVGVAALPARWLDALGKVAPVLALLASVAPGWRS